MPRVVAEVDEDQSAVIAAARDPAGDRDRLSDALGVDLAAIEIAPAVHPVILSTTSSSGAVKSLAALLPDGRLRAVDEDRPAGAQSRGLSELALGRASGVIHVGTQPAATQLGEERKDASTIAVLLAHEEHVDVRRLRAIRPDREQEPFDAGAEADARRRRPADLLDEPVVAAAAADRVLRADRLVLELERRPRVVVEAADERRGQLVADAVGIEVLAHVRAKCSRHSSQSDSPIFGAPASSACTRSLFTSKTLSGDVARLPRASSSSSSSCSSSHLASCST